MMNGPHLIAEVRHGMVVRHEAEVSHGVVMSHVAAIGVGWRWLALAMTDS